MCLAAAVGADHRPGREQLPAELVLDVGGAVGDEVPQFDWHEPGVAGGGGAGPEPFDVIVDMSLDHQGSPSGECFGLIVWSSGIVSEGVGEPFGDGGHDPDRLVELGGFVSSQRCDQGF